MGWTPRLESYCATWRNALSKDLGSKTPRNSSRARWRGSSAQSWRRLAWSAATTRHVEKRFRRRSSSTNRRLPGAFVDSLRLYRVTIVSIRTAILLGVTVAIRAGAQQSLPGYAPQSAATERVLEAEAIKRPSPAAASGHSRALSKETHVSGTPAQAKTRDYVIEQLKGWGLETEVRAYDIWMPHPTAVHVSRLSPQPKELSLREPPVAGDPTSALWQYPTVNGYSGAGDAT